MQCHTSVICLSNLASLNCTLWRNNGNVTKEALLRCDPGEPRECHAVIITHPWPCVKCEGNIFAAIAPERTQHWRWEVWLQLCEPPDISQGLAADQSGDVRKAAGRRSRRS